MNTRTVQSVSPYTTREVREVSRDGWNGWLLGAPGSGHDLVPGGAHVLQSYEWGELKRRWGWEPVRLVLERDGEVVGLGQFLAHGTMPIPGALWYCTKGPWLPWEDEEAVRAFFEGVAALARQRGAHTVKIEPEVLEGQRGAKAVLGEIGFRKARYDLNFKTTLIVDLERPEEEVLAGMKRKTRYNVRLAARKGVEVVEPEFDEGFDTFYAWMEDMARRKSGFVIRRPREYLRDSMRAMYDADQGRFFFAVHEGRPLAGMYFWNFGEKGWYIFGVSGEEKANLKPNYLLQWEVMRWARRRGITYYDMVGIPKPEEQNEQSSLWNVFKFKESFGGEMADSVGCIDLPVNRARARAWYKAEPLYYRGYQKLKKNVFY